MFSRPTSSEDVIQAIKKIYTLKDIDRVETNHAGAINERGDEVFIKWGKKVNPNEVLLTVAAHMKIGLRFQVAEIMCAGSVGTIPFIITKKIPGDLLKNRLVDSEHMEAAGRMLIGIGESYGELLSSTAGSERTARGATTFDIAQTLLRIAKRGYGARDSGIRVTEVSAIAQAMTRMLREERNAVWAAHNDIHAEHVLIPNNAQDDRRPFLTDLNRAHVPEGRAADSVRSVTTLLAHTLDPENGAIVIQELIDEALAPIIPAEVLYPVVAYNTLGILRDCNRDVANGKTAIKDLSKRHRAGLKVLRDALKRM